MFHFTAPPTFAQNAAAQRTLFEITRLAAGAMVTGFHVTMPSVMSFSELPSQLPWPLRERCPFPLQTSRHPPPYLEPWSSGCSGHSCHLISSATDGGRGCIHPRPCPAGWCPTHTGVSPLSLLICGGGFHPHRD